MFTNAGVANRRQCARIFLHKKSIHGWRQKTPPVQFPVLEGNIHLANWSRNPWKIACIPHVCWKTPNIAFSYEIEYQTSHHVRWYYVTSRAECSREIFPSDEEIISRTHHGTQRRWNFFIIVRDHSFIEWSFHRRDEQKSCVELCPLRYHQLFF